MAQLDALRHVDIDKLLAQAGALEKQQKWKEAIAQYDQILKPFPTQMTALRRRGLAKMQAQDLAGAVQDFSAALEINPDLDGVRQSRGQAYVLRKDYPAACRDLVAVVSKKPDNASAHFDLAHAYYYSGDLARALTAMDNAVRLAPTQSAAWDFRARLQEKAGNLEGALADEAKAVANAKDPKTLSACTERQQRLQSLTAKAAPAPIAEHEAAPAAAATTDRASAAARGSPPPLPPRFEPLDFRSLSNTQYNGALSVAMEGLRQMYAPMGEVEAAKFEKTWAERFNRPSAKMVDYLNKLIPLVQQFLSLRTLLGESAAAYDKALEEATFAAGYANDSGVQTALAEAGRCKAVLIEGQSRLQALTGAIQALGNPPDAVAEQKRQRKRHDQVVQTTKRALHISEDTCLKVEFTDLPTGWILQEYQFPSLPEEVRPVMYSADGKRPLFRFAPVFGFVPPLENRFAYLHNRHDLLFSYYGGDLYGAVSFDVRVYYLQVPRDTLRSAIENSFSAKEAAEIAHRDDLSPYNLKDEAAERAAYEAATNSFLPTNFNGVEAFKNDKDLVVYFIRLEPGEWVKLECGTVRTYRNWFKPYDVKAELAQFGRAAANDHMRTPTAGDFINTNAELKRREETYDDLVAKRIESLVACFDFSLEDGQPPNDVARQQALLVYAVEHEVRPVLPDQLPVKLSAPWGRGEWHLIGYPVVDGTPSASFSGNALRGDNFSFVWDTPPQTLKPGQALKVTLRTYTHNPITDPKSKDDSVASLELFFLGGTEARNSSGYAHQNAKFGPTDSAHTATCVIPPLDGTYFFTRLYVDASTTGSATYHYRWMVTPPESNPTIPDCFLVEKKPKPEVLSAEQIEKRRQEAELLRQAEEEKKAKIETLRANVGYLQQCLAKEREEQGRATNDQQLQSYQFRILGIESDITAEEDLIASLQTGTDVHTRSAFDHYAAATFQQQCQAEAQAATQVYRAVESANRLAALLSPEEAAQAREFVERQFTPQALAEHDAAKARKVVEALYEKVQGKWQGEAAKADASAATAQLGMDAATNIKTAADTGMSICSLFGGSSVNLIYQAGTGYVEGGPAQAARNALTTWSDACNYAFTAYDGYKEGGAKGALSSVVWQYAQAKGTEYIAGKLLSGAHGSEGGHDTAASGKPTLQEQFDAAKFKQEREWGEALVKDFEHTQNELLKAGAAGAAPEAILKLQAAARDKAAAVASSLHAKNYLKYKADPAIGKAYDTHMRSVHAEADANLKQVMQERGWNANEWELMEFRNASSYGKPNMDRDVGLRERGLWALDESGLPMKGVRNPEAWTTGPNGRPMPKPQLTKDGKPMSLDQWREEAQAIYNATYRKASGGRSAEVAMEGITTSSHPEAYKDLLWLGNDKSLVNAAWAGQAGDVTRYKAMHLLNKGDPSTAYFTKLQEVARGTAKDMESKLAPLLKQAKPVANPGPKSLMSEEALTNAKAHWGEVQSILQDFGRNDLDPLTATRRIRELTGGKSIPEVVDEMATLMESLAKGSARR